MRGAHKKKGGFKSHSHLNSHLKFLKKEKNELPYAAVEASIANNKTAATEPQPVDSETPDLNNLTQLSTDSDIPPFSVGHNLIVKYRDGSMRLAKIIERRKKSSTGTASMMSSSSSTTTTSQPQEESEHDWRYYIHYHDFNRRMDEWIDHVRIVIYPSKALEYHQERLKIDPSNGNESTTEDESVTDTQSSKRIRFSTVRHEQQAPKEPNDNDLKSTIAAGDFTTVAELEHDEHEGLDEASVLEHEEVTKVKNFLYVQLGRHIMECWYFSPLPKEYHMNPPVECIYFCEFTFRFFKSKDELSRFQANPNLNRYPPGNEIYRDSELSMFEVDGAVEKVYCQNLCYFAKLFLDHKTLYWDVDPFLFYVLCTYDERGYHPVGYFSKEKYSDMGYNLACILTFPSSQRKGYGKFLINFSYELSKKEEKVGSPEKPLSDLGAVSYRSYWASVILKLLRNHTNRGISIMDISRATSFLSDDILLTLNTLGLLQQVNGENIIYAPNDMLDILIEKFPISSHPVDPDRLHWTPLYVLDPRKDRWSLKGKRELFQNLNSANPVPQQPPTTANTAIEIPEQ